MFATAIEKLKTYQAGRQQKTAKNIDEAVEKIATGGDIPPEELTALLDEAGLSAEDFENLVSRYHQRAQQVEKLERGQRAAEREV